MTRPPSKSRRPRTTTKPSSRYEVVRDHPDTGRVQLVAWDKDEVAAARIVSELIGPFNGIPRPTMATSGKM